MYKTHLDFETKIGGKQVRLIHRLIVLLALVKCLKSLFVFLLTAPSTIINSKKVEK